MATRPTGEADALAARPAALRVQVRAADPEVARALAARVRAAGHATVVGEVAVEGGTGARGLEPDVVVADRPGEYGAPLLVLGAAADDALSTLPPEVPPAQLDAALRAVAAGLVVRLPQGVAVGFQPADPPRVLLTPRELEILACLSEGMSNKGAARRLGISAHTVKFHLESVFTKLGATSRADAVARGLRRGVIEL